MTSVKPIFEPPLIDLLRDHSRDIFRSMNCVAIGRIEQVDTAKKTAEVHLVFKRRLPDGTTASYPPLLDVPLVTIQGGGVYLQMPVTAGDKCLVVFADRNIDGWYKTGVETIPYDARSHSLSDAIAIVGLDALTSAQPAMPTDAAQLAAGAAAVRVKKDGSAASVIQGTGEVTAVGGKVRVKSATTDLLTALNGLIDALKGLTIQDPQGSLGTVSASSQANLDAQKTILGGLLST
jgi:hypothetical protein